MTARRRLFTAAGAVLLLMSGQALAQPDNQADTARTAGQAAHAVGDAANQVADQGLPGVDPAKPKNAGERARQGVVMLERNGKPLGLGSVLSGDGRILTALSAVGSGNDVDARFADGSTTRVKVGHTDRGWDLALLVPQNGRWKKGLKASRTSATKAGLDLKTFSVVGQKQLALSRTILKGERTLVGGDSALLRDALEFTSKFKQTDLGSPIVDDKGDVVGVLARACAPVPNAPCTRVPFGVPVSAVKAFLRTVPANAVPPAPWLGIQGVADDLGAARGVRVLSVHPRSPAAAAGLKGGKDKNTSDTVVAVDGMPVLTPDGLAQAINDHAVGDTVQLLLFGNGKFRQTTLTLSPAPNSSPKQKLVPAKQPRRTQSVPRPSR